MGFKAGFEKVAFVPLIGAAVGTLGRMAAGAIGRGLLGAGRLALRGGGKVAKLGIRAAGGPLNAAFTAADVAGQTSSNLQDLKSVYR